MNEEIEQNGSFGIAAKGQDRQLGIMRKIGNSILQKALFPSKAHLKHAVSILDLAIKAEFILLELCSSLFWCSYIEIINFIAVLLCFITSPSELSAIWWFSPHIIRGALGFLILIKMPMTHDIIKNAEFSHTQKMKIEDVFSELTKASKNALDHFTILCKRMMLVYAILTVICAPIDLVIFCSAIKNFSSERSPYADCTLLIGSIVMLSVDIFYMSWINSLQHRVPPFVSAGVTKAMFGSMEYLHKAVGDRIEKNKAKNTETMNNGMELKDFEQQA